MFRALAILASIVGASAFAPVARVARSSSLKMDYSVSIFDVYLIIVQLCVEIAQK